MYETGLFEAQATSVDRLICLHHPDTKIPDPIEGYHAVAATKDEVEKFLRMVFVNDNPIYGWEPINKAIEDEIPELANEVVNAIRLPEDLVREVYEPFAPCSSLVDLFQLHGRIDMPPWLCHI